MMRRGKVGLGSILIILSVCFFIFLNVFSGVVASETNDVSVEWVLIREDLVEREYEVVIENYKANAVKNLEAVFLISDTPFSDAEMQQNVKVVAYEPVATFKNITYYETSLVNKTYTEEEYIQRYSEFIEKYNTTGVTGATNVTLEGGEVGIEAGVEVPVADNCAVSYDAEKQKIYICEEEEVVEKKVEKFLKDYNITEMGATETKNKITKFVYKKIEVPKKGVTILDDNGEKIVDDGKIRLRVVLKTPVAKTSYGYGSYGMIGLFDNYSKILYHPWWNTSWGYRKPITINNTATQNLTNYTVVVSLDTQTLISQGKMRSDCGDIRFVDDDNVTLLPHYVYTNETNYTGLSYSWGVWGCNTTNTRISVRIPFILNNSTKTIYMYYGNPSATYNNNLYNIFVDVAKLVNTTLPSDRYGLSCAPYKDAIYCFGGRSSGYLNQIVRYNITSDNVTIMNATLPQGVEDLSCAPYRDAIYCFGGDAGTPVYSTISRYNVTSGTSTTMNATLTTSRSRLSCAPYQDAIYCFGGYNVGYLSQIDKYNVTSDTTTLMNVSLPTSRGYLSCAPYQDAIYCFGGYDGTNYLNKIVRYNVTSNSITTMNTTLPTGRYGLSCAPYQDAIYCFGGYSSTGYLNQIVRYNVTSDTRTTMSATLPTGRNRLSCAPYSDAIYCFGGYLYSGSEAYYDEIVRFARNFSSPEPTTSVGDEEVGDFPPYVYSYSNNPSSGVTYSYSQAYNFSAVVCDDNGYGDISITKIELNLTNYTSTNYTIVNSTCLEHSYLTDPLSAGSYNIKWWVVDNADETGDTSFDYVVSKATPQLILKINNVEENVTGSWLNSYNISVSESNVGDADVTYCLHNSTGQMVCSSNYEKNYDEKTLKADIYIFTYNSTEGQNYTSGLVTRKLTIYKEWEKKDNITSDTSYYYDADKIDIPVVTELINITHNINGSYVVGETLNKTYNLRVKNTNGNSGLTETFTNVVANFTNYVGETLVVNISSIAYQEEINYTHNVSMVAVEETSYNCTQTIFTSLVRYTCEFNLFVNDKDVVRNYSIIYNVNYSKLPEFEERIVNLTSYSVDNKTNNLTVVEHNILNYVELIIGENFSNSSLEYGEHVAKIIYFIPIVNQGGGGAGGGGYTTYPSAITSANGSVDVIYQVVPNEITVVTRVGERKLIKPYGYNSTFVVTNFGEDSIYISLELIGNYSYLLSFVPLTSNLDVNASVSRIEFTEIKKGESKAFNVYTNIPINVRDGVYDTYVKFIEGGTGEVKIVKINLIVGGIEGLLFSKIYNILFYPISFQKNASFEISQKGIIIPARRDVSIPIGWLVWVMFILTTYSLFSLIKKKMHRKGEKFGGDHIISFLSFLIPTLVLMLIC